MSLLLRSVWRSVLRASPLVSELTRGKSPDAVMLMLKTAPSATDVLEAVQANLQQMTPKHLLQALRMLFQLQKTGKVTHNTDDLIRDPAFGVLCQNFKKHARSIDVNEAIEATKFLSFLGVPVDSLIIQTMLQIIRCEINTINIRQIMFLDFILNRFEEKNHLVDALKLALPLAFQIHLPLEIDNDDLPLLRDMLAYCCSHDLPDRCINNVVTGILLHNQAIDAQIAKYITWALCQVNCTAEVFPTRAKLLNNCLVIMTQKLHELPYDDILRTAAKLKGRILEKHPEYYNEQLMDGIADYVVKNNLEFDKVLLVARVLSRIAHTHLGLVEYLCQLAVSNPTTLSNARTNVLFGFINCLSNSNYSPDPDQWNELRRQLSLNPILDAKSFTLPWAKMCLELASLGHYEDRLISRVLSQEFLDEYLSREQNTLDYLQLLTLNEAVKTFHTKEFKMPQEILDKAKSLYPTSLLSEELERSLAQGLGSPEYVVKNVMLQSGIVADALVCLKNGYPQKLPRLSGKGKVPIEQLNLPNGGIVVCIMNFKAGCFSMNSNRLRGTFRLILDTLEKQGYATVAINTNEWLNSPPHERTPYLLREISYKCSEIGMKLCAT
ncbi:hypothetical protein O3G_MSEX002115 [Manduca sexta]|uniref:RAP domain-containing protein n=1 Tax=Manduca sexta TaxID=7130 RepID=A0A921YN33_MANSE|nr:hypothetical protein O3G_MSEX002115 [Manduca sexta]